MEILYHGPICTQEKGYRHRLLITALFGRKYCKQPKYPSIEDVLHKLQHFHKLEYYVTAEKNQKALYAISPRYFVK